METEKRSRSSSTCFLLTSVFGSDVARSRSAVACNRTHACQASHRRSIDQQKNDGFYSCAEGSSGKFASSAGRCIILTTHRPHAPAPNIHFFWPIPSDFMHELVCNCKLPCVALPDPTH